MHIDHAYRLDNERPPSISKFYIFLVCFSQIYNHILDMYI